MADRREPQGQANAGARRDPLDADLEVGPRGELADGRAADVRNLSQTKHYYIFNLPHFS